jgi:hypothetical protein
MMIGMHTAFNWLRRKRESQETLKSDTLALGNQMKAYEFWDIGEVFPFPNLGKTSTARVMQALVKLGGRMHDSHTEFGDSDPDQYRIVEYRISLLVGKRAEFEELAGYKLTRPAKIQAGV